jgi:hypothetical protein
VSNAERSGQVLYQWIAPAIARRPAGDRNRRRAVVALAIAGAALFGASYFLPWWNFHLVAPQYPQGLDVQIALTGVSGSVSEIDILNHYVGMQSLSAAAATERAFAGWLVSGAALALCGVLVAAGRKLAWTALIPAIGLPLGFVVDTSWWMWRFGHELDPKAPITFPEFTPVLFGTGTIAQFHTFAWPALGFWAALAGVGCVVAAEVIRRRVCRECPRAETCGLTCPHHMVGGP